MQLSHDAEAEAIAIGLFASVTVGACLIVAALIKTALRERERDTRAQELFNLKTGLHPADDIYGGDSWPEFEQFIEQRPDLRERHEREAWKHREKGRSSN